MLIYVSSDLWGLDENGYFRVDNDFPDNENNHIIVRNISSVRTALFGQKSDVNIPDRVKSDIQDVAAQTEKEIDRFYQQNLSDREKSKRILFHFQKDLMAGLSGQVLESHDRRAELTQKPYSRAIKQGCWFLLFMINAGMLFYIFLFGVSKDAHHQNAWAKSFAMWLLMEIVLISSAMVLVMNVLIPMLTMKDLKQIKLKLVDTIVQYNKKLHHGMKESDDEDILDKGMKFNAAKYLFVSYRLAKYFPELRVSKIILAYETHWPRQSYLHIAESLSSNYDRRFAAMYQAATMLLTYVITTFLTFPAAA